MEYRKLSDTGLEVSSICLGTMTWGEQNTEKEAHLQMDYSLDNGINFFDSAELYPIPPKPETQGLTEKYIGSWLKKRGNRDKIILATKVVGRTDLNWFRNGPNQLDKICIEEAVNSSLERLGTDYIDLYQLHWPDRPINLFGGLSYKHIDFDNAIHPTETLRALGDLVTQGKIRHIGLSNETPWGLASFLKSADEFSLPRVVSVQNVYNLLSRVYENGLSEFSYRDNVGLLAYSPLAQGYLSGKYQNGARPAGARTTLFERGDRYETTHAERIIQDYLDLASDSNIDPVTMSLAFVNHQSFVTSNIIGATNLDQLKIAIDSHEVSLSKEIIKKINDIHLSCPNPCP
ncbi:MAG: NADP(H)-dependent aldo-keto reductase [SAR86 cluster bacterium]|jgi:aryl-alcohol dehydrogenase-like predicted oxidoreductase|nr:NADP(H)-dependent aldo-keto reductase [SAR86 cluster bacterium]